MRQTHRFLLKAYSAKEIDGIITRAMRSDKDVKHVSHIIPRAYCVSKDAPMAASFAVPPCDQEPQMRTWNAMHGEHFTYSVSNITASNVHIGDWCQLAYVVRGGAQENIVVRKL